ncbi:MAG: hypothetical protein ACQKBV_02320 [Puniceicoccales bacterium]
MAVSLEGVPEDDELLLEAWRDSLLEQLEEDVNALLELIGKFGPGETVHLTDAQADGALRAAAAIRLKIREVFLNGLPNQALETGNVDLARLSPDQHKPYACYSFLAGFQEAICAQLMPDFYDDFDDFEEED